MWIRRAAALCRDPAGAVEDNYFALLPGEKRTVTATYHAANLGKGKPVVQVDGWNVSGVRH